MNFSEAKNFVGQEQLSAASTVSKKNPRFGVIDLDHTPGCKKSDEHEQDARVIAWNPSEN